MSELKTFGLGKAKGLVAGDIHVERYDKEAKLWFKDIRPNAFNSEYRLTPGQELTFEQACLLVGLGLRGELEEDYTNEGTWRDSFGSLSPAWLYRTRPLPKQTKIIPHTMETAPAMAEVKAFGGPCVGETKLYAHTRSDGKILLVDGNHVCRWTLTFEEAREQLALEATGKPYGMEVEA